MRGQSILWQSREMNSQTGDRDSQVGKSLILQPSRRGARPAERTAHARALKMGLTYMTTWLIKPITKKGVVSVTKA